MAIDGFKCKSNIVPLKEWFATEFGPDGECRPCRIRPLASLYLKTLETSGEKKSAEELEKTYEGGELLTIAEFMDTIKMRAGSKLRQDLEELDCFAESYKDE